MPRLPRLELPGVPLHVTQRGVNRCAIFLDDEDRHHYRHLLRKTCRQYGVAIHAFVLMDNHVHLLVSCAEVGGISRALGVSGQSYAQGFNTRHGRSGTLWQGRFKSCLVDSDRYLLAVIRYIELNPLRAAMVSTPEEYRWSSVHTHLCKTLDPLVTPHPVYLAFGRDPVQRAAAYRRWLMAAIDEEEITAIRNHLTQERAFGDQRFQRMVEKTLNRPVACRPRGRPVKVRGETD
jgi:putative transposase